MPPKCHFSKNLFIALSGMMLFLLWSALNIGTTFWVGGMQMDTTTENKYTLTTETKEWLKKNKQHLYIKLYVSENLEDTFPLEAQNIRHIIFLLEQYKRNSNQLLEVEVIPVRPFAASEKEAEKQGIRSFSDDNGQQRYYAGAVLGNDMGDSMAIPYFAPQRQHYLEHDFSRILSGLTDFSPKKIAVISPTLPLINKRQRFDSAKDWDFIQQLRQNYDVDYLPDELVEIPLEYDAVLLINPQQMENISKYALDQYLLYGGNLIIFMDPFSEMELAINGEARNQRSNMKDFLASKGISYDESQITGDATLGMEALSSSADNGKIRQYPLWMQVQPPYINPESPITKGIKHLNIKSSGSFSIKELGKNKITTLFTSSDNAGEISTKTAKYSTKPYIKEIFEDQKKRQRLGLLIEGNFSSLVSRHPLENSPLIQKYRPFVSVSIKSGKLMLLGDSDLLANHSWNMAQGLQNQSIYDFVPYNNNMDFVEKIVDYMSGNQVLISATPKITFNGGQTLNAIIEQNVWEKHQQDYDNKKLALQLHKEELAALEKQLSKNLLAPSVAISQKTTMLSHNINLMQDMLDEQLFQINNEKQQIKRNIILLNVVVFPSILLLMVFAVVSFFRRQTKQKAKEYADD